MASGKVWVSPGMAPAKVTVAPNSPKARANPSSPAATRPGAARGRVTRANTARGGAPSTAAASSSPRSTPSIASRKGRTTSGRAMMVAASAAPVQWKARETPKASWSARPIGPLTPKRLSRINPVTTGGRTSGMLTAASMIQRPGNRPRARTSASARPTGRQTARDAVATLRDSQSASSSKAERGSNIQATGSKP